MKSLYFLVRKLSVTESTLVEHYLKSWTIGEDSSLLKLFQVLRSSTIIPDQDWLSNHLYEKPFDNTLRKLCPRLKAIILDTQLSNVNIEKARFDEIDRTAITVRKKMAQFHFIYKKHGSYDILAKNILESVITTCITFENYSTLIEALHYKKYFTGFSSGIKEFDKIQAEINFYEQCYKSVIKANDYYYKLIINQKFHSTSNNEQLLVVAINELKKDFKKTNSAIVGYYLKQLEIYYYKDKGAFSKAEKCCMELLELLFNNRSIFVLKRIAFAYDDLAHCSIYIKNYEEALLNVKKAQQIIPEQNINYLISKEIEFYILFYNEKIKGASITIKYLIENKKIFNSVFNDSKYNFLQSFLLFKKREFSKCFNSLIEYSEISKDKGGWNFYSRVLRIKCMIELKRKNQIESQFEGFKRFVLRNNKDLSKRNILIFKTLQTLNSSEFNYEKKEIRKNLNMLSEKSSPYSWVPLSPELIPFHEWLEEKINEVKKR